MAAQTDPGCERRFERRSGDAGATPRLHATVTVSTARATAAAEIHCSTRRYSGDMEREISQRELRNNSGEIMRAVKKGESFIVTSNGEPIARLSPLRDRYFVPSNVVLEAFKGAPNIDYKRLRADLDAVADPSPWRDD